MNPKMRLCLLEKNSNVIAFNHANLAGLKHDQAVFHWIYDEKKTKLRPMNSSNTVF